LPRSAVGSTYNDYRIDRSSEHVTGSYLGVQDLFNNTATNDNDTWGAGWQGSSGSYSTSTGEHSTYVTGGTTQGTAARLASNVPNGEWVSLQLPNAIQLNHVKIRSRNSGNWYSQYPTDFEFWGSNNNGTTWSHIKSFSNKAAAALATFSTFQVDSTKVYSRIALVVTKIIGAGGYTASAGHAHFSISELHLYGVPEYDPEAHGTDVTVKSVANVPNTDWLEVYYDAKNYTSGAVQDETSNNRDATLDGVVYDSVSKSFTFDGDDKIYTSAMSYTPTSNYTASLWFKVSEFGSNQSILFQFGHGSSGESFGMNVQNGDLAAYVYGGSTRRTQADIYSVDEWVHATCIANNDGTVEIYFNGRLVLFDDAGQALTIPSNPYLSLGLHFSGEISSWQSTLNCLKGSIANFRLFNRALTSDEIYQLYAYQKEDFGHSTNNMTLKAGRLGIGTSEPRGALDVRGDAYYGCPVFFTAYSDHSSLVTVTGSSAGTVIVFNKTTVNKGGAYDLSNGRCTFPISGYYEVFFRGGTANATDFHAKIYRNGIAPGSGGWPKGVMRLWDGSGNTYRNAGTIHFFYYFTAGEYIEVRLTNNSVFNAENYNSFSVKYLSN
jgi:hypothetical protein